MKDIPTLDLITLWCEALHNKNQELINVYAYELVTRLYKPNKEYTFEDLLYNYGYKVTMENQITIEEYIRSKKNDSES